MRGGPSFPTPFSSLEGIDEPCSQMTSFQTEADPCPTQYLREKEHSRCFVSRVGIPSNHGIVEYDTLDPVVQRTATQHSCRLPRNSLGDLNSEKNICDALTADIHVDFWKVAGTSPVDCIIISFSAALDAEDDLYKWQRSTE